MNAIRILVTASTLSALAACGGSATGPRSFSQITDEGTALANTLLTIPYTEPSALPRQGTANYDGYMYVELDNSGIVAGEMEMQAQFAGAGNVSGRVYNVVDENEVAYTGELAIQNGAIDRNANLSTEYTYTADMTGTLRGGGNTSVVNAALYGDFTGANHQYVEGIVIGNVTTNGTLQSITDGGFVGQ